MGILLHYFLYLPMCQHIPFEFILVSYRTVLPALLGRNCRWLALEARESPGLLRQEYRKEDVGDLVWGGICRNGSRICLDLETDWLIIRRKCGQINLINAK